MRATVRTDAGRMFQVHTPVTAETMRDGNHLRIVWKDDLENKTIKELKDSLPQWPHGKCLIIVQERRMEGWRRYLPNRYRLQSRDRDSKLFLVLMPEESIGDAVRRVNGVDGILENYEKGLLDKAIEVGDADALVALLESRFDEQERRSQVGASDGRGAGRTFQVERSVVHTPITSEMMCQRKNLRILWRDDFTGKTIKELKDLLPQWPHGECRIIVQENWMERRQSQRLPNRHKLQDSDRHTELWLVLYPEEWIGEAVRRGDAAAVEAILENHEADEEGVEVRGLLGPAIESGNPDVVEALLASRSDAEERHAMMQERRDEDDMNAFCIAAGRNDKNAICLMDKWGGDISRDSYVSLVENAPGPSALEVALQQEAWSTLHHLGRKIMECHRGMKLFLRFAEKSDGLKQTTKDLERLVERCRRETRPRGPAAARSLQLVIMRQSPAEPTAQLEGDDELAVPLRLDLEAGGPRLLPRRGEESGDADPEAPREPWDGLPSGSRSPISSLREGGDPTSADPSHGLPAVGAAGRPAALPGPSGPGSDGAAVGGGRALAPGQRLVGRVKSYNPGTGYGFVESPCPGRPDVFVHSSQLVGRLGLAAGERVEFDLALDRGRPQAWNVRVLHEEPAGLVDGPSASTQMSKEEEQVPPLEGPPPSAAFRRAAVEALRKFRQLAPAAVPPREEERASGPAAAAVAAAAAAAAAGAGAGADGAALVGGASSSSQLSRQAEEERIPEASAVVHVEAVCGRLLQRLLDSAP